MMSATRQKWGWRWGTGVSEFCFDLAREAWLPVRFDDGTAGELGLVEVLQRAHEVVGLDLDYPTQEPALLRLLLACCHRLMSGPVDEASWKRLWADGHLPAAAVESYFSQWSDRFDLFSGERPFFQVPGLESVGKDGVKTVNALVAFAPSGNNVPVFTPLTNDSGLELSPADAARWLVERHAWGTASDKTGAKGNTQVKAGKYTPRIGHLAWIGFVAPIGETLFETLLLNLIPWDRSGLAGADDLPAWEREPLGPVPRTRPAGGVCDLFTWQGRRVRLFPELRGDQTVVTRVLICAGDEVARDAVRSVDPHTGWRRKKEKDGSFTYSPIRARPGQQVWRGLASLLASGENEERARVLSWLARLESIGVDRVSLLVTSAEFGQMSTTVTDLVSDRLDAPVVVLRREDLEAATVAEQAVALVDAAGRALWRIAEAPYLAYDAEKDSHLVPEGRSDQARAARAALAEELFGALDAAFRRFLLDLATYDDVQSIRGVWAEKVAGVAWTLASGRLAQLSAAQAYSGAVAESRFRYVFAKARAEFTGGDESERGAA